MNKTVFLSWAAVLSFPVVAGAQSTDHQTSADVPAKDLQEERRASIEPTADELKLGKSISQRDAVAQALKHNPSLKALVAQRKQAKWSVKAEESRYQYIFGADASFGQSRSPQLQPNDQIASNLTRDWILGAELRRQFSVGTELELRIEEKYFQNSFGGGFNNPILNQSNGFSSTASVTLTQPLLRGFGTKSGELELRAARANLSQADKVRLRGASELIRDTLLAYAELWYATRALAIERASLALAEKREQDAQARVRTGSLAPADALSFSSQVAERRESMVAAEGELENRTISLLQLTGGTEQPELLAAREEPTRVGVPSALELERSLQDDSVELAELRTQIKTAKIRAELAGDELRPRMDVQGSLRTTGLGENAGSSLGRAGGFNWVTGQVSLVFEAPVGTSRKQAQKAEAQLAVVVVQENLKAARDRINAEVRKSQVGVRSSKRNLDLAQKTREIAEKTLVAEQKRYATGTGVSLQVQEADDTVRRARLREARARVDLSSEEIRLQHLSGGLIRRAQEEQLLESQGS